MGIQEYLDDLLDNQLQEIKYRFREKIVKDIKERMCSLLSRWEEEDFRRTVLFNILYRMYNRLFSFNFYNGLLREVYQKC